MRRLRALILKTNVWLLFFLSVLGAVIFSELLGLLLNALFADGVNRLLLIAAAVIPAIDAPIFIIVLIDLIKELRASEEELDHRVSQRTEELEEANVLLQREVRERQRVEQQLAQAQKMEAIGTMAGGIAHDFNNILTPIIGYTQMLIEDAEKGSPQWSDLQEILTGANRAKGLVAQILAFSRQGEMEVGPLRLQSVLKEVLKLIRSTLPSTIEIISEVDERCGSVRADPTQVHRMVMNLVTNAYHAMADQGGALTVSLRPSDPVRDGEEMRALSLTREQYAQLRISDTGCGMAKSVLDKIFEPYFTTRERGRGTGLGLSVVHGIVTSYDGAITVESSPGQGSTFSIYLPIIHQESAPTAAYVAPVLRRGTERVLVVDDDDMVLQVEAQFLRDLGYKVTAFDSSLKALAAFEDAPLAYDLVMTDMTMPKLTGDRLAQKVMQVRPDVPVILCTGYSELIDAARAREIGIRGYLSKPLAIGELSETIREVLDSGAD